MTPPSPCAFQALSGDNLRRVAPSIFASNARPGVSARYTFVSTHQVIDLLHSEGWVPVNASEQRVRLDVRRGFQLHEIRFARRADLGTRVVNVGDVRPEMILQNAHDGTRAYRIDAGLYRLVCRNGLVVADADFAHVALRHSDVSADRFAAAAQGVAESTPRVLETVARWQAVRLTPGQRHEFAKRAAALRWDDGLPVRQFMPPERLLEPLRYGDGQPDLWSTFNAIQEHLLRGGDRYHGSVPGSRIHHRMTRPVGSLRRAQVLNKLLWSLAAEFAAN